MSHPADCPCCRRTGTVTRPSSAWGAVLVLAYAGFAVMIFGAGLLGPTIMVVLPLLAAFGLGVLPVLHARAGAPATCAACGKIVPEPVRSKARSAPVAVGVHA